MTSNDEREALIAEAREHWKVRNLTGQTVRLLDRLADALESTAAELRQERERADEAVRENESMRRFDWLKRNRAVEEALSRAEETIENARLWLTDERMSVEQKIAGAIANLTEYGKQKGAEDD